MICVILDDFIQPYTLLNNHRNPNKITGIFRFANQVHESWQASRAYTCRGAAIFWSVLDARQYRNWTEMDSTVWGITDWAGKHTRYCRWINTTGAFFQKLERFIIRHSESFCIAHRTAKISLAECTTKLGRHRRFVPLELITRIPYLCDILGFFRRTRKILLSQFH